MYVCPFCGRQNDERLDCVGCRRPLEASSFWFRARNRLVVQKTFDPTGELRLPAWLSRVFELPLAAERFAIARGMSLPAGGSLLLVGRRMAAA